MIQGIQPLFKSLGEYGCYFLSLCKIAEEERRISVSIVEQAYALQGTGLLGSDCYIKDASAIASTLLKAQVDVIKAGPGHPLALDYTLKAGEREILRFERTDEHGTPIAHFVVGDGKCKVAWDPWPGSKTVAEGTLVSRRIIRRTV